MTARELGWAPYPLTLSLQRLTDRPDRVMTVAGIDY